METSFRGRTKEGREFVRDTLHYWTALSSTLELQNVATGQLTKSEMLINLQVTGEQEADDTHLVYAQVWGSSEDGKKEIPVAWISGMSDRKPGNDFSTLSLSLDLKWISLAKAHAPFSLKKVRVQDRSIQNELDSLDFIPIKLQQEIPPEFYQQNVTITQEMRRGRLPEKYRNLNLTEANHKLLLVHGYCADGPPYSQSDFTDYVVFDDPYANRNLQEFAELILKVAQDNKVDVFSIVAHSQGGLASLHLKTYYFSPLDLSTNGRRIQSVGSPYQGTALAGGLASIGRIFGYGCGSNEG